MPETQPGTPAPVPLNVAFLRGRISGFRTYDTQEGLTRVVTTLRLAAADEYSSASAIEVDAPEPLGKAGEVVSVKCAVGGSIRNFKWTDKESGELKRGAEAKVRFVLARA